jgi:hypothetical protein
MYVVVHEVKFLEIHSALLRGGVLFSSIAPRSMSEASRSVFTDMADGANIPISGLCK